ncbi:MAG: peptidylprolyl isomerase [bacterium]|nr:peptidylprolyl isomerase [bacterium]
MKKVVYLSIFFCLFVSGYVSAEIVDRVVAKVGSEVIFWSDLEKAIQSVKLLENPPTQEELLNQLIDRALLLQEAKRQKIIPSEQIVKAETKRQLARIRNVYKTEAEFQQELNKVGLTQSLLEKQFERRAREELMIQLLIRKKMKPVTDAEIEQYTVAHPDIAKQANRVRLRHIFFSLDTSAGEAACATVLEKANIALSKLKSGEKWEEIVKEYSDDQDTRMDNGDLGFITHGDSFPEIEAVAFELPIGKISDLIKTELGYHIIQVTDRMNIRQYLENEAFNTTKKNLINELRQSTKIEIKL